MVIKCLNTINTDSASTFFIKTIKMQIPLPSIEDLAEYDALSQCLSNDNASSYLETVNEMRKNEQKKRRVEKACVACRNAHVCCQADRPCKRCIRKGIGHLCVDYIPSRNTTASQPLKSYKPKVKSHLIQAVSNPKPFGNQIDLNGIIEDPKDPKSLNATFPSFTNLQVESAVSSLLNNDPMLYEDTFWQESRIFREPDMSLDFNIFLNDEPQIPIDTQTTRVLAPSTICSGLDRCGPCPMNRSTDLDRTLSNKTLESNTSSSNSAVQMQSLSSLCEIFIKLNLDGALVCRLIGLVSKLNEQSTNFRNEKADYQIIFDALITPSVMFSPSGMIQLFNKSFISLITRNPQDIFGSCIYELMDVQSILETLQSSCKFQKDGIANFGRCNIVSISCAFTCSIIMQMNSNWIVMQLIPI